MGILEIEILGSTNLRWPLYREVAATRSDLISYIVNCYDYYKQLEKEEPRHEQTMATVNKAIACLLI